ncbi:B12-binding domain-containing radical SAM protein [Candidatus Auribacterota bacterium]
MNLPWVKKKKNSFELVLVICPAWGVIHPPVGISYLKNFLSSYGINVKCIDLNLELYRSFPEKKYWNLNYPEYFINSKLFNKYIFPNLELFIHIWTKKILSYNPKAVGFSLFMSNINASLILAKQLKKLAPNISLIAGGPEVTRAKRIFIDKVKNISALIDKTIFNHIFDILVLGEGEETLLEIMMRIKKNRDLSSLKGTISISKENYKLNAPRERISNLDKLPPPNYCDYHLENYTQKALPITTSRGCINRCTFCADSPLWKTYRYRSAPKILEEIQLLIKEHNITEFEITDSTFNGDIKRLHYLCELIITAKINLRWSAKVTLRKEMDLNLLKKMNTAGCFSLSYGLESGSQKILDDMKKNTNINEAKRIIRQTYEAGIKANCFFIIGYPTETEKDFQLTLDFIKENAEFIFSFNQITGCHIEDDSYLGLNQDKYGIFFKKDGWHSQESTPKIRKKRLDAFKELGRALHKHYQCEVQM